VNRLDLASVALLVLGSVIGWSAGFLRRAFGWAGLLGGFWVGSRILPELLGVESPADAVDSAAFLWAVGVLMACGLLGQLAGAKVGSYLRSLVRQRHLGRADQTLGAVAGVAGVTVLLWLVLPSMALVPGWAAEQARASRVAQGVHDLLGPPPAAFDGIGEALGLGRLPTVFEDLAPSPEVQAPPKDIPVTPEVLAAVQASTVKLSGAACGRIQSGSGFVVRDDLVVTNAHVIAGTRDLRVSAPGRPATGAVVVAMDTANDLALVHVPDIRRPALPLGDATAGDVGIALGYPGGGDLTTVPFRIDRQIKARGRDIYDEVSVTRNVFVVGADLAAGDSGGPLADPSGRVVAVAFAIAPDEPGTAYAIDTADVRPLVDALVGREPVPTGPCV